MEYIFSVGLRHSIESANHCYYKEPSMHPTRRMQFHDLIYIVEGEWKIGQENEKFTIKQDEVLILFADLKHYGVSPCSPKTKTMYIHAIPQSGDKIAEEGDFCENGLRLPAKVSAIKNSDIKKLFQKTIQANLNGHKQIASAYLDTLLYELSEAGEVTEEECLADGIKNLIIASAGKILKNEEIAKKFNVCKKTAETAFKNSCGKTIHQFNLEIKAEQAKYYLINSPQMKLYEIAQNLGFYDEYHFSRQFKRIYGVSPGEYRKINGV